MSNNSISSFDASHYKKSLAIHDEPAPTVKPEMVLQNYPRTYEGPEKNAYLNLMTGIGRCFGAMGAYVPCCVCKNPYEEIPQGKIGMITTFGKLTRSVLPGLAYVNTWTENVDVVSVKLEIKEIPEQECFTKDNVSVSITSVVYYNIIDPEKAWYSVNNIHMAIAERTQTTLRDVIGSRVVQDIVEKREQIAEDIQSVISKTAYGWGVNIESILIKGIRLPPAVQQSLSLAAEARRLGESKIIKAKAEVESAKLMRKASDILASKAAMQIRYLEALQSIAKTSNCKTIFMPSSQEIEKVAGNNMIDGIQNNATGSQKESKLLEEDPNWAGEKEGSSFLKNAMNTIALQES